MKIKTGGKELLESETFLALDLGETAITIGDSPEKLNFIFDFVEADGEKTAIKWMSLMASR